MKIHNEKSLLAPLAIPPASALARHPAAVEIPPTGFTYESVVFDLNGT